MPKDIVMLGAKDPKAENVSLAFAHQEYLHNFEEILRVSCGYAGIACMICAVSDHRFH